MSTASPTPSPESVLLVQCCHLPQFFYLAEKLRQRNPEWILSALVTDRPHVRFYLELFPPFDHLFFFDKKLPEMPGAFDQILFPLLNRGYLRIKRAARQLPGIAYKIDYQGERRALKLGTLVRSFAAPLHRPSEEFVQYLEDFPHRPLGEKVLVVETCHRSLADSSEEKWGHLIPDQAEVTRISVSTEGRGWRTLRRQSFDSGVVFFSGEKGFANLKLLPFLLGIPKILVVNEHGDHFYATYRSLLRFLWGRVWQGAPLPKPSPRILVIQTESPTYVRRAIEVLRKPEMFPRSRICLLCRKEDADRFRNVSSLESVLTYSRRKVGSNVGLWRDLKGFDAVAAVFSGRGVFRKQKLLYFLLPIRHHLAFNARSDCYRLTPRTLFWTLRKDPSLFAAERQPDSPILFLLTDEDSKAVEAIERLQDPKVVSPQPIWVFCREDKRSFYQALPGVEEVRTYAPGRTWENLKTVLALARGRVEVVSSIFSPQPAFRLQKLLFVLLPARHRLAFNQEDLNCYYLKGSHDRSGQPSVWGTLLRVLLTRSRRGVRPTLFFPTAEDSKAVEAIERLQDPKVVSPQPIWVFCREDKRSFYQALPGVEEVRTYAPGRTWENLKTVLALARGRVEVVSSIFSPQPAFRLQKLLFVLLPARHRLAFNQEDLNCYYLKGSHDRSGQPSVWGTLLRVLLTRSRRGVRPTLFFPTAEDSKAVEAIERLQDPKVVSPQPIWVFCREDKRSFYQALPGVEEVRTYAPGRTWENLKTVLALARGRVEVVSSIFSPQPAFRLQKLLFVLLPARHRLAFNQEDLNCYYLKGSHDRSGQPSVWGTLLRVLLTRSRRGVRPTLFFPTAEDSKAVEAIERLQDPKVVSPQPIWVFCREDKRSFYQALPGVEEVRTYAPGRTWENLKTVLALARGRVEVVSSIFSPQPAFRLQKLLFVLLPARHRLAFNQEDLNCYYLKGSHDRSGQPSVWGTLLRVLLTRSRRGVRPTLFFPTAEDSKAVEAIERLQDPKVVSPQPIWVFCREDKRSFYQALPGVEEVRTYAPGRTWENLKTVLALARGRVEVVSSIFSPQPAFRLQKLLFVLLPARHRLAFNQEDLNCYYLKGSHDRSGQPSVWGTLLRVLLTRSRRGVRPTLFFPTAEDSKAVEAIERLQDPKVVSPQPIWVFCREDKRSFYQALPGVEEVRTYAPGRTWENLKTVLALARGRVEVVSSIFSPQPAFRLQKLLFVLLPARHRLAFNQEDLNCYYLKGSHDRSGQPSVWGTLLRVLLTRSRRGVRPTLFFPTAEDSKAVEAIERLQDPKVVSPQPIWVFCREDKRSFYQALPGVEEVRTYAPGRTWENLKTVLALARGRVEVVSSIFSPQPAFRLQKLLFVLLPARHRLAFNQEDLNCYYLKGSHDRSGQPSVWGTLLRVLLTRSRRGVRPTLFFPTAEDSKAVEAIERLQDPKVVSPQPIWVFCREDKRSFYQALPGVEEVRTYAPGRTWENLKTVLALARGRVEVVSSIFSPQPAFRLQKLLFVLLPARHRLAFNQEDLNCYYLKGSHDRSGQPSVWGTLLRVLLTRSRRGVRPTLFFPTAEDSKAVEAIERLQDPKIAAKSIVVFCREDKRPLYEDLPTVEAVWTYAPGSSLRHLRTWVRLLRTRVDLVCAIFSGRPTFRLQKFLFLTLRARNRLVFNEDLNCYMLRGHLARFLQPQGRNRGLDRSVLILVVRKVLKWFLFVPRFLYLILWAAVVTMRARHRISQERRR